MKSRIYREKIEKPLNKLVENIINRFKFPYFQEVSENLKADVVSFLILNLDKYDQEKGRAFSYFSILAKNYLILGNNEEYKFKKIKRTIDPSDTEHSHDVIDEDQDRIINDDVPEFIEMMVDYWENNINTIFSKRQEIMIADAILNLFRLSENIENFNKKALYLMIREMTGLRTQYITAVVNKMRMHNEILLKEYNLKGVFETKEAISESEFS